MDLAAVTKIPSLDVQTGFRRPICRLAREIFNSKVRSDIFSLLPKGQPVRRLRAPPSKELKQDLNKLKEEGSQNKLKKKIKEKKSQKGKSTRRDSNLRHRFA